MDNPTQRRVANFFRCLMLCVFTIVLLVLLSGCVHRQWVNERYPRWGEETAVQFADTGGELTLRTLAPASVDAAPACVLLVHGMNEHIGRYGDVARLLAERYVVTGFDFYAHGLSNPVLQQADRLLAAGASQADVSDAFLAQVRLYDLTLLRQTLDQALRHTVALCDQHNNQRDQQQDAQRPVFIVAHSLGALVTASYLLQAQPESLIDRIGGVVLLGPAFAVSEPPGWRGWLANPVIQMSFHAKTHFLQPHDEPLPLLVFNQLFALMAVPLLDGMFEVFSWPGIRYLLSPVSPDWVADYLTDSEAERTKLRADGWIVRRTLLRFVKGIETEIVHFRRQMHAFTLPYLLIASEQDPITPASGSHAFARATLPHHPDNAVHTLPGLLYHQHLFLTEPQRSELLRQIEAWIDHRLLSLRR